MCMMALTAESTHYGYTHTQRGSITRNWRDGGLLWGGESQHRSIPHWTASRPARPLFMHVCMFYACMLFYDSAHHHGKTQQEWPLLYWNVGKMMENEYIRAFDLPALSDRMYVSHSFSVWKWRGRLWQCEISMFSLATVAKMLSWAVCVYVWDEWNLQKPCEEGYLVSSEVKDQLHATELVKQPQWVLSVKWGPIVRTPSHSFRAPGGSGPSRSLTSALLRLVRRG